MTRLAIIGGGVAAHTLVKSLLTARTALADAAGTTGTGGTDPLTVDIFTAENHPPYRRPEVNKGILLDGKSAADVALPGGVLDTDGVTLHLNTRVTAVDPGTGTTDRTVTAGTTTYHVDGIVFATGAGPRLLAEDWLDGRDVHYIRTPEHATALRDRLTALGPGDRVVVIGGGVLGLEAAAAAAQLSEADVHVLELADEVCSRILPPTASRWLRDRHREHTVTVTCGIPPEALPQAVADLDPAVVVVSVGAVRDTMLAEDAGLAVGDGLSGGIVVDEYGRTAVPGVFAVGDCVEIRTGDGRVLRPEDDGSARTLAGVVAAQLAAGAVSDTVSDPAVVGGTTPATPSFLDTPMKGWTKQYGHMLNLVGRTGLAAGQDLREHVIVDTPAELVVFTVDPADGDTVVGVTTVGRSPEVRSAKNALGTVLAV